MLGLEEEVNREDEREEDERKRYVSLVMAATRRDVNPCQVFRREILR